MAAAPRAGLGATYAVDPGGNDDAAGTQEAPWRTIQRAANAVQAGDEVIVQPGIYREAVYLAASGQPGSPIVFRALPGAVLESPDPAASLSAFDIAQGVAYVVLDGFEATGGYHETIYVRPGAHDISVRNCRLHRNRAGIWVAGATAVEIDGCLIEANTAHGIRILAGSSQVAVRRTVSRLHNDGLGCAGNADGFIAEETTSDIEFADCTAEGNGEDGFDLQGSRIAVRRSRSVGNGCAGLKLDRDAVVENALIANNTTGIVTTSGDADPATIAIANSTVADNRGTQLLLRSPAGSAPQPYTVDLRNVVASGPGKAVEVESGVLLRESHNLFFRDDTTSGLLVLHTPEGVRRYTGQQINEGVWAAETGLGTGTLAIPPDFLAPGEYHLAAASAAVDRGTAEGAPGDDLTGTVRPQGYATDIGAYEEAAAAQNHPPWPDPGPDRTATAGAKMTLSAYGSIDPDGDPVTYTWDFGDGTPPVSGYSAAHVYAVAGDYIATLTASDGTLARSRSLRVRVVPPASPDLAHDSLLVPRRRARAVIRLGQPLVAKTVRVQVKNGDVSPSREKPGHIIRLVADDGTCPAGTVAGLPDFDRRLDGAQDSILVPGGQTRTAHIPIVVGRDAAPGCFLSLTAITVLDGNLDPNPQNDTFLLELLVRDKNPAE